MTVHYYCYKGIKCYFEDGTVTVADFRFASLADALHAIDAIK